MASSVFHQSGRNVRSLPSIQAALSCLIVSPCISISRYDTSDTKNSHTCVNTRMHDFTTTTWSSHKGRLKPPLPKAAERKHKQQQREQSENSGVSETITQPTPKPELVERYLSLKTPKEQRQEAMQAIIQEFQRFPGDTGSSEVQAALLTSKIAAVAEHLKIHRKDYSSRRGLMAMLNARRQLLQYLRRTSFDRYAVVLGKLGLKDAIGKTYDRLSSRYHD